MNPRIREIIRSTLENVRQTGARRVILFNELGELSRHASEDDNFYAVRWQEIFVGNNGFDAQNTANEELRDLLTRAQQSTASTPETIEVLVASAAIANVSQLLYNADLLNVFLQHPAAYRRTLDVAGGLAKAVALDLAGHTVPFLETITTQIDTVFNLMEPRIGNKMEEMRQATEFFDRVCDFDNQLTELLGYQNFVEETIQSADRELKPLRLLFKTNTAWFSAVLSNAERA